MAEPPGIPGPCPVVGVSLCDSSPLLWRAADLRAVRSEGLVGSLIGALTRTPRQNARMGRPLLLLPEERRLLAARHAAATMPQANQAGGAGLTEQLAYHAEQQRRSYEQQSVLALTDRKGQLTRAMTSSHTDCVSGPEDEALRSRLEALDQSFTLPLSAMAVQLSTGRAGLSHCPEARGSLQPDGPIRGEERAEEPMTGEERADRPIRGEERADGPIRGEERAEEPIRGEERADRPIRGEERADGPIRGEERAEEPIRGEERADRPIRGEERDGPIRGEERADGDARYQVYTDLRGRGFFLTSAGKFGGDFLVYPGDPLRFHAHYIAVCLSAEEPVCLLDLLAVARLGSNVKKTVLLCSPRPDGGVVYTSLQWSGMV